MVRVFIKGGTWKNSEDEILKAAVMKYGKQQWARVASLLNRKSAKQCKARWNEWLDPSVRKVEWSRAEDEKLLHLAKLMPAQWRTIGPLVGRTGGQCQERYERLLDEAAGGEGAVRKLRPGEIDPHPETKPARPDPMDMDEDEIEMLQEARARLANTQGKKAKRKAREKMLGEAKRLADLQKRRELKAAGLMSGQAAKKGRRGRDIDLGVEIPFHKPAPVGFHSTKLEDDMAETIRTQRLKDVDYKRLQEMQYRTRDREAKERQKREEVRIRNLERSNMQYVVAEVAKRNDPILLSGKKRRGVLTMPQPTVAEEELIRVAKASDLEKQAMTVLAASSATHDAGEGYPTTGPTDALLGDYTDRPLPTPMRTPASISQAEKYSVSQRIQLEALNLHRLSTGQTPLLGEENIDLIDTGVETAAMGATPLLTGGRSDLHTNLSTGSENRKNVNPTPLTLSSHRDELGLNTKHLGLSMSHPPSSLHSGISQYNHQDDTSSVGASSFGASSYATKLSLRELAREERRRIKHARQQLEKALANLPAPQFEYELAVPEEHSVTDDLEGTVGSLYTKKRMLVKDAADEDAEEMARLRKEAEKLYEAQSSVMKRLDLPRPRMLVSLDRLLKQGVEKEEGIQGVATKLIYQEMMTLLGHDAHSHPILIDKSDPIMASLLSDGKGKKDKNDKKRCKDAPALDYFTEESLNHAKQMIENELNNMVQTKIDWLSSTKNIHLDNSSEVFHSAVEDMVQASHGSGLKMKFSIDESDCKSGWTITDGENDRVQHLYAEYKAIQTANHAVSKACTKLQQKLEIQTGGYIQRSKSLIDMSYQAFAELQHSKIEESVYLNLHAHETQGIIKRIERLQEEVDTLEEEEGKKQKRYGQLIHDRNRLLLKSNSSAAEIKN